MWSLLIVSMGVLLVLTLPWPTLANFFTDHLGPALWTAVKAVLFCLGWVFATYPPVSTFIVAVVLLTTCCYKLQGRQYDPEMTAFFFGLSLNFVCFSIFILQPTGIDSVKNYESSEKTGEGKKARFTYYYRCSSIERDLQKPENFTKYFAHINGLPVTQKTSRCSPFSLNPIVITPQKEP